MPNTAPLHIIHGPMDIWLAAVGTAFPTTDGAPSGSWEKLSTNGSRDTSEDGVVITNQHTLVPVYTDGLTAPVKFFRTREGLVVAATIYDFSLEKYDTALNGNSVATTAAGSGTVGYKSIKLYRGADVAQYALLARGQSPYVATGNAQFEVPIVVVSGEPKPVFKKGEPVATLLEFTAQADPGASATDYLGALRAMHAAAL